MKTTYKWMTLLINSWLTEYTPEIKGNNCNYFMISLIFSSSRHDRHDVPNTPVPARPSEQPQPHSLSNSAAVLVSCDCWESRSCCTDRLSALSSLLNAGGHGLHQVHWYSSQIRQIGLTLLISSLLSEQRSSLLYYYVIYLYNNGTY